MLQLLLSKLYSLKASIENFVNNNNKGTIILSGIEQLSQMHNWENIKQFIFHIQIEVISPTSLSLILLFEDTGNIGHSSEMSYFNTFSTFISPVYDKIIEIISHNIRKNVILILRSQDDDELSFNKILKSLSTESSSILAFHLNKLVKEDILIKRDSSYSLSPKGHYLAEVINILEKLGEHSPLSPIKVFKIPKLA